MLCNKKAGFQNIDCRYQENLNVLTTSKTSLVV